MRTDPFWKKGGVVLVALVAGFWLMLRWFEHSQVYHPTRPFVADADELGRPHEEATFVAADGTSLHGWFFPAHTNSTRSHLAIIYCHGNGGNISHRLNTCEALLATGVSVLIFDYRGYGRSSGKPDEEGTYMDAEAAHAWLMKKGFPETNLIAYGESLGGGVATELAGRRKTGGLILQSTFTSIPDIGAELFPWLPVRWLSRIHYATQGKLPSLKVPLLVMHSRDDGLIPFTHAETNFASANEPKRFCEIKGNHNYPLMDRRRYHEGIEDFLQLMESQRPK